MISSPSRTSQSRQQDGFDPAQRLEVWGGVEPTVNRVGDDYLDQLAKTGHDTRIDDLDRFAELGMTSLRYPLLWEKIAPGAIDDADWAWPDARLERLRELGIRPIVGLVHHGSGPIHTNLLDRRFPEKLAAYAGAVARRYPWLEDYTPVNEPLTTARFSALYGHWYPHERDDRSFARAFMVQCRAIVLAMQAVREVNPDARLIQTEELGMVHSTPKLAYQAEFENERRWLTYDLLAGQLTPDRRMWTWLLECGIDRGELEWFLDNPCPPDVLGINYYLTSERYLDWRIKRYPGERAGGNSAHSYVDVAAVRVLAEPLGGVEALLRQAWDRYHLPIAITEVHNGSTREEQLRWLNEVWQQAGRARRNSVDIRAITVWALLGLYDWDSLVTEDRGRYEPGVFDIRGPEPRPTALARMTRDLATRGTHSHPVLDVPGWWRWPDRLLRPHKAAARVDLADARRILVIPADPLLTGAIATACHARHIPATVAAGWDCDEIERWLAEGDAWAVIRAGTGDDSAGEGNAADSLARQHGIPFVTFGAGHGGSEHGHGLVIRSDGDDTPVDSLAHAALDLLIDGERGQWYVSPAGEGCWPAPVGDVHAHEDRAADD